jgi:hypothetical protein
VRGAQLSSTGGDFDPAGYSRIAPNPQLMHATFLARFLLMVTSYI